MCNFTFYFRLKNLVSLVGGIIKERCWFQCKWSPVGFLFDPLDLRALFMHVSTALKKSKERFENEMSEHGSARDMQTREAEATGRISGLERKIQYAEIEKV